ncbi:DUF397 domain-containing protein [Streptomyces orinoci]|uniref:DUF397 domain-containing protein n=1 Tax=Streptomyces orinoci TaxID=67339 RepID=A0ABV3JS86_STRON|nr:DUF397 domain-containing protein [Streptomyces orinoci]
MTTCDWQKSSYSAAGANCVNIAATSDGLLLRESDDPSAVLDLTGGQLRALIRAIRRGTVG